MHMVCSLHINHLKVGVLSVTIQSLIHGFFIFINSIIGFYHKMGTLNILCKVLCLLWGKTIETWTFMSQVSRKRKVAFINILQSPFEQYFWSFFCQAILLIFNSLRLFHVDVISPEIQRVFLYGDLLQLPWTQEATKTAQLNFILRMEIQPTKWS